MTRSELVKQITKKYEGLELSIIQRAVEVMFEEISSSLSEGRRVELRGFGAFAVKQRKSRMARNPRTGDSVYVPPKSVLSFKPGKMMRERLNPKD